MANQASLALVVDPTGAVSALRRFDRAVESSAGVVASFARNVRRDFEIVAQAAGLILKPLTALVGVAAAAKASMTALGAAALGASAQYETFAQQLLTVMRTKEEADRAFAESIKFSVETPFTPEEIIRTRIELESVGIRGGAAIKSVAEAAAAMNRSISDVAAAIKSMETEPLRRLGVQAKKEGDEFVFQFRDKMGEAQRIVVQGFEEAQQALLGIFDMKFEGGIKRMSLTFDGLVSTLKGAVQDLRATFGEGFLDQAKLFVNDIIQGIASIKDSARTAGVEFGREIERARINLLAGLDVALQIARDIAAAMQTEGGVGAVILESLKLGATILGQGILAAFRASISLWKVIGVTIGEGVLQAVYQSNIPGSGLAREYAIRRNLPTDLVELQSMAAKLGIPVMEPAAAQLGRASSGASWGAFYTPTESYATAPDRVKDARQLAGEIARAIGELPIEQQLEYAQLDATAKSRLNEAIAEAEGTLESGLAKWSGVTLKALQDFENRVAELAGRAPVDIQEAFTQARERIVRESEGQLAEWNRRLNPAAGGERVNLDPWAFEEDLGEGGMAWLKSVQEQVQAQRIGASVAAEYANELRFELDTINRTREAQEKAIIVRQATAEAMREQVQAGLPVIGLGEAEREELERLIDRLHEAEKMKRVGDEIGYGFARGFQTATMHARNLSDALKYLGDAALNVLDRVMEITIWEPMAQSISSAVTSRFAPRAGGGSVYAGSPYWVGEMGPELFIPDRTGDIIPNYQAMRQPSPVQVPNVSIQIENNSQGQVEAQAEGVRFDGRRLLVSMMVRDKHNNGPISRANRGR